MNGLFYLCLSRTVARLLPEPINMFVCSMFEGGHLQYFFLRTDRTEVLLAQACYPRVSRTVYPSELVDLLTHQYHNQ